MAGDERYLIARDSGPARALARDVVDSRRNLIGLFMPLALLVVFSYFLERWSSRCSAARPDGRRGRRARGHRVAPARSDGARPPGGRPAGLRAPGASRAFPPGRRQPATLDALRSRPDTTPRSLASSGRGLRDVAIPWSAARASSNAASRTPSPLAPIPDLPAREGRGWRRPPSAATGTRTASPPKSAPEASATSAWIGSGAGVERGVGDGRGSSGPVGSRG